MHYHYFTLEQRDELAQAIQARIGEPGMAETLGRLHSPDYGVCQSCGRDIAFQKLLADPSLQRCPQCASVR